MKTLVFDFDGTLCHSMPLIDKAFKDAIIKHGPKHLTAEQIKACFGPNESGILLKLVGKEKHRDAFYEYLKSYEENHDQLLTGFFPGIEELLEKLKEEGYTIYVLTGRSVESTLISFSKLHAFKYFEDFYCGDLLGAIKDKRLLELCDDHNLKPEDLLYVGDSLKDVIQCQKVGVKIISVKYDNFESSDELDTLNPGMVAENVAKLEYLIDKYGK